MIVHVFATFLLDQGSKQLHRVPVEYKLHQQVEEVKAHFMDPVNSVLTNHIGQTLDLRSDWSIWENEGSSLAKNSEHRQQGVRRSYYVTRSLLRPNGKRRLTPGAQSYIGSPLLNRCHLPH